MRRSLPLPRVESDLHFLFRCVVNVTLPPLQPAWILVVPNRHKPFFGALFIPVQAVGININKRTVVAVSIAVPTLRDIEPRTR